MNDGYSFDDREHETLWFRGHGPERYAPVRRNFTVTLDIKINVASCLMAFAVILSVLLS